MATSESGARIDQLLRAGPAKVLKRHRFTKRARTFHRRREDKVDVLHVQASQWNRGSLARFTVNLGIYLPAISRVSGVHTALPAEVDCHLRVRLGQLMPVHRDFWWELNANSDDGDMAIDVCEQVERYAFPWFDRHQRLEDCVASRELMGPLDCLYALIALGDVRAGRAEVKRLLKKAMPIFAARVRALAARHELD